MSYTREDFATVSAEPCHCVRCGEYNGTGNIWRDIGGKYLGDGRSDDLDQMESCENCGGSGITQTCDRCQLLSDMDHEEG